MSLWLLALLAVNVRAAAVSRLGKTGLMGEAPSRWTTMPGHEQDISGSTHVGFSFRKGSHEFIPLISVTCYPNGNPIMPTSKTFLDKQAPVFNFQKPPKISSTTVAGRPAKQIMSDSAWYKHRESLHPHKIPTREESVVFDRKGGFCVLSYEAQADEFARFKPAFDTLLRTLVVGD